MNILFISASIGATDGSSKQLAMTANAMAHYGHRCFIYIFDESVCGQLLTENVIFLQETHPVYKRWQQWIFVPGRLRRIIKQNDINVIIGWRTNGGCYAVLSAIGTSAKTVFSERSDPYLEDQSWIHKVVGAIAGYANGGVFQTGKARDYYKYLAKRACVIPNPFQQPSHNKPILDWEMRLDKIVYVGRLRIKQKRQDLLLKAFKLIHEQMPSYSLHIYGEGADEHILKEAAKELRDFIFFHGAVLNVSNQIRDAKLLLLTSDYEGIPNVVIEAFCVGVPVIATDCSPGGMHVLIDDGINGFISPFRDYEDLAKKSIMLLKNSDMAKHFIDNSKKKLSEFDPTTIFEQWDLYIKKIANSNNQ